MTPYSLSWIGLPDDELSVRSLTMSYRWTFPLTGWTPLHARSMHPLGSTTYPAAGSAVCMHVWGALSRKSARLCFMAGIQCQANNSAYNCLTEAYQIGIRIPYLACLLSQPSAEPEQGYWKHPIGTIKKQVIAPSPSHACLETMTLF